jgi:hypothetical protein
MPYLRPPRGITPPAPGLDKEEPTFVPEEDIPTENRSSARSERSDERPQGGSERE